MVAACLSTWASSVHTHGVGLPAPAAPVVPRGPSTSAEAHAWAVLAQVLDPEVPALSVVDLGIVRSVSAGADGGVRVQLTPTYSGCPATEAIESAVRQALQANGFVSVHLDLVWAPAWTSDWISEEGRDKLKAYGIAPPPKVVRWLPRGTQGVTPAEQPHCPRCHSANTERLSAFGATACKSLHRCRDCQEPFEQFKAI